MTLQTAAFHVNLSVERDEQGTQSQSSTSTRHARTRRRASLEERFRPVETTRLDVVGALTRCVSVVSF